MAKLTDSPGSRYGWRGALVLPGAYFDQPVVIEGRLKVWTGAQWETKLLKVWTGTVWEERPVQAYYDGSWL